MDAIIRRADPADAAILSVLATEVWLDTYAPDGVSAAYARHLVEEYSPAAFEAALRADGVELTLCARGDFVLGYAKLVTAPQSIDPAHGSAEVATLYVRRHHKREGLGTLLLGSALGSAARQGHRNAYLTVHHRNRDALAFYAARGFRQAGERTFSFQGIDVPNIVLSTDLA